MEDIEGIDYEQLAEIDLDALDAIPDSGLRPHFLGMALKATEGQLRDILALPVSSPLVERQALAEAYADRRAATALRLRSLRKS